LHSLDLAQKAHCSWRSSQSLLLLESSGVTKCRLGADEVEASSWLLLQICSPSAPTVHSSSEARARLYAISSNARGCFMVEDDRDEGTVMLLVKNKTRVVAKSRSKPNPQRSREDPKSNGTDPSIGFFILTNDAKSLSLLSGVFRQRRGGKLCAKDHY